MWKYQVALYKLNPSWKDYVFSRKYLICLCYTESWSIINIPPLQYLLTCHNNKVKRSFKKCGINQFIFYLKLKTYHLKVKTYHFKFQVYHSWGGRGRGIQMGIHLINVHIFLSFTSLHLYLTKSVHKNLLICVDLFE